MEDHKQTSAVEGLSQPAALTIATSDSSNGAGIGADLKTFMARGVCGLSVHCCLTAQNPDSVSGVVELDNDFIRDQFRQIETFYRIRAAKTGMLFSTRIIETVVELLEARETPLPLVVDPVMVASSGAVLLKKDAIETLRERLLPLATLITPNLDEAAVLLGQRPESLAQMEEAARELVALTGRAILLKGGHLGGSLLTDLLARPDVDEIQYLEARSARRTDTHGSGCTLSAAITAELAWGRLLEEAVNKAHDYLQRALHRPVEAGPRLFINHAV
jgi:hydroxymethylpyrimidine/phosphomethylpyrimidine kinase